MTDLSRLPQVDELIRLSGIADSLGHQLARSLAREAVEDARARALAGHEVDPESVVRDAQQRSGELDRLLLRDVINATGVVLHTNLGRASLSTAATDAAIRAAGSVNLEIDLGKGERGSRAPAAARLVQGLTGAEAALVVNNNAGALVLALAALATGREVIVSRGELIEIGGEFRLPSIMEVSGAVLHEVGTTNRTRASDVRTAVSERTGLILKVHPSNYRIVGFTDEAKLSDLGMIAREAGVPLLHDIGSGLLAPDDRFPDEPDATTSLVTGADLVCFSGDKLLGGPQAGIIAGKSALVAACGRHPLARALRADKLTLAALEATLLAHARGKRDDIPVWRMLTLTAGDLRPRAEAVARLIGEAARTREGESVSGGGSMPDRTLPTVLVAIAHEHAADAARELRRRSLPVVVRIDDHELIVDLRTVEPARDGDVAEALRAVL